MWVVVGWGGVKEFGRGGGPGHKNWDGGGGWGRLVGGGSSGQTEAVLRMCEFEVGELCLRCHVAPGYLLTWPPASPWYRCPVPLLTLQLRVLHRPKPYTLNHTP